MKMNGQSRAFAKQVQVDLLALSDDDLLHMIHHWVDGKNPPELSVDVPEDTRLALGYTHVIAGTATLSNLHDVSGVESESSVAWRAPSSHQLRTLIAAMDVHTFAQHVIPLAFKSLHAIYPEWYEGVTFNAHLANYLRQISTKRRTISKEQSIGT